MKYLLFVILITIFQTSIYSNFNDIKCSESPLVLRLNNDSIIKTDLISKKNENNHTLSGKVLNGVSLIPIPEAVVIVYDSKKEVVSTLMTDDEGSFEVFIDENEKYTLEYFHEDYNIRYKKLEKANLKFPDYINLYLDPGVGIGIFNLEEKLDLSVIPHYIINSKYVLDILNIYFDEDECSLKKEFIPTLDEVVNLLNDNKALKIEIAAHTSSGATDEYNKQLSEKRAKKIYDYLIRNGINQTRLVYMGYGSSEPLIYNFEAQQKNGNDANRRIEFRIVFD